MCALRSIHVAKLCRISTDDQNLDLQHEALQKAGCDQIFFEEQSRGGADHFGLAHLFETLRAGGTLGIWRLDRLDVRYMKTFTDALKPAIIILIS
jgi:DNA invertase Pin-like site-specific DNA recombinase